MNQRIKRSSGTFELCKKLRRDIVLSQHKDGDFVTELELCEKYDCTRSAVRESLIVLESEGLIKFHSNGTKSIMPPTGSDINNLYEFRCFIELTAIKSLKKIANVDLSRSFEILNFFLKNQKIALEQLVEADIDFHGAIVIASENKVLIQAWDNIAPVLREIFFLNTSASCEKEAVFRDTFNKRHLQLIEALTDPESHSEEIFKKHIDEAWTTAINSVHKGACL